MASSPMVANLEAAIRAACAGEEEWPARVSAGVCAGVDFAIAHPGLVQTLDELSAAPGPAGLHQGLISRLAGLLQEGAPSATRPTGATDESLVARLTGLVADHLRVGRQERLVELRADLVLLALLPYLGFSEARRWANEVERSNPLI